MKCWICGNNADTKEHLVKASDLRSLFGVPDQKNPVYFHSSKKRNYKVGSLKAKVLKSSTGICNRCNSATTQQHDFAWQQFSENLRARQPPIAAGNILRANHIFPYNTASQMRNVHLYFVKIFGCRIVEGSIPIDISTFSKAILGGRPHPNLFLVFGTAANCPQPFAGGSNICMASVGGECVFASWFHHVGRLLVNVMFAIEGERRDGLADAWHPSQDHKRIRLAEFVSDVARN